MNGGKDFIMTDPGLKHQTAIFQKLGELMEKNLNHQIDWEFIGFAQTSNIFKGRWYLYLEVKISIIKCKNEIIVINKRNEMFPSVAIEEKFNCLILLLPGTLQSHLSSICEYFLYVNFVLYVESPSIFNVFLL